VRRVRVKRRHQLIHDEFAVLKAPILPEAFRPAGATNGSARAWGGFDFRRIRPHEGWSVGGGSGTREYLDPPLDLVEA
jgi:hypothetical protein